MSLEVILEEVKAIPAQLEQINQFVTATEARLAKLEAALDAAAPLLDELDTMVHHYLDVNKLPHPMHTDVTPDTTATVTTPTTPTVSTAT